MHLDLQLILQVRVACYDLDEARLGILHCIFHQVQEHPHQLFHVAIKVLGKLLPVLVLLLDGLAGLRNPRHLKGRHKVKLYSSIPALVQLSEDFLNFYEWCSCIENLYLPPKVVFLMQILIVKVVDLAEHNGDPVGQEILDGLGPV